MTVGLKSQCMKKTNALMDFRVSYTTALFTKGLKPLANKDRS
jgi:hypothetical protein